MITVESFHKPCGCRSDGECTHNTLAELDALDALVDAFAAEMKRKLRRKALEGRSGWDDPQYAEGIRSAMIEHANRGSGQEVDVANLAAMLWNMGSNMKQSELSPEISRFENDPRDWDWDSAIKECLSQEPADEGDGPFHGLFLGSVFAIMPSGKYWTCFACGNVDEDEQERDIAYHELLEACADEAGGWIELGLNGDLCDMFFCLPISEELDESMDGDHESALASAGFGTDEDYGGGCEHY